MEESPIWESSTDSFIQRLKYRALGGTLFLSAGTRQNLSIESAATEGERQWPVLFNSWVFVGFFAAVYATYLLLKKHYKAQNVLLLVASYVFYGYWDWRFLSLIALSTVIDYVIGLRLPKANGPARKRLVVASVTANLTILGFFKYFNFFVGGAEHLLSLAGFAPSFVTLNIVLPVGISFYTFQTMSYTIDIYRGRMEPTKSFLDFALFVSFFPQLVAGPIERAASLLPQISQKRTITTEGIHSGVFLILWGYYKKIVIADNLGIIADRVFNNYQHYQGLEFIAATLAFAVQIYCDFSGYSDIARGLSKLMGIDLMVNFKLPYFALNPSDFWLRWHVSLSSWLRDYLYIPLGGNRGGSFNTYRNLFLTMLLGGLWHGAAWNFVIWGAYHGGILILYRLLDRNPEHEDPWSGEFSKVRVILKMGIMFILTLVGWVIFRAGSVHQIAYMLSHVGFGMTEGVRFSMLYEIAYFSTPLVLIQLWQYKTRNLLAPANMHPVLLGLFYAYLLVWITVFAVRKTAQFIYFQF